MQTFKRICIKDFTVTDGDNSFTVERGKEYTTSAVNCSPKVCGIEPKEDHVTVMSRYWLSVPVSHFAGEQEFTTA